ncbi:protein LAZY 1 [Sesamum alatum]|uniref:Protein LAZY 1 n=1 Tax=Sesamum alatum TaxID=300844 RepID=A0AAE1XKK2_9LAMI|nr:protein LAZY 1 [Sesamum alatum]
MHRKFRQNNNETPKDFSIGFTGQPSLDDLQCYPKGSYCGKSLGKAQRDNYRRNSFTCLEAARVEEEELDEEPVAALTELFHGFLAIGTLGTEPITTDPATPTFSISVDHIAEKETEVTENELKLINDELEKVLGAEGRDESCNVSSGRNSHVSAGRNSHVSAGRMSHCSTITLSGKPIESAETCGNGAIICPLQSYLFGSAIGLPDTAPSVRREQRTSLGELFQKTKQAEECHGTKSDRGEKRTEKETEKSAVHLMKKMLKKRTIHASSRSSTATQGGTIDSSTAETKLHKILHIFNRKVHPENSISCLQSHKPTKNEINNAHLAACNSGGLRPSAEDIIIYPQRAIPKENTWSHKNQSHLPQLTKSSSDIAANEFWVKTDADYLVLEL